MKRFTKINEAFTCVVCGKANTPAAQTCRNHCQFCLNSLHVDVNPGDRAANCGGILRPVGIELKGGQMQRLLFRCERCGMDRVNKIAVDDDRDKLLKAFSGKA
jgi:transcription elongation factor Elf1